MKFDENNQPVLNSWTGAEYEAVARRDYYMDAGDSQIEAARSALDAMDGRKTAKFVEWLSGGALVLDHGDVKDSQPEPATT